MRPTPRTRYQAKRSVSISDEKPLHMRLRADSLRRSSSMSFNLRREAAPHATGGASPGSGSDAMSCFARHPAAMPAGGSQCSLVGYYTRKLIYLQVAVK